MPTVIDDTQMLTFIFQPSSRFRIFAIANILAPLTITVRNVNEMPASALAAAMNMPSPASATIARIWSSESFMPQDGMALERPNWRCKIAVTIEQLPDYSDARK